MSGLPPDVTQSGSHRRCTKPFISIGYTCTCRYTDAQSVFRHSLAVQDKPHTRWLLGDALTELGELQSAKAEYEAVLQHEPASEAERTHATQQLAALNRRTGQSTCV